MFPGFRLADRECTVDIARASRQFLVRVVRYLAADAGIRQFLDIGTGLPTVNNTRGATRRAHRRQAWPTASIVLCDQFVSG